jgi:hypothetical protein
MGVRLLFMAGMIMIVNPMIPFMTMVVGSIAMVMIVVVPMGVIMTMAMDVFVTMLHISVRMLMGVHMRVVVIMQVFVFMFSFHHQLLLFSRLLQPSSWLLFIIVLSSSQLFVNELPINAVFSSKTRIDS